MKKEIRKILKEAIEALQKAKIWPDFELEEIQVDYPSDEKFGDYSSNIAMLLAKKIGKSPIEIANQIKTELSSESELSSVKSIEVVAPGYINFYLSKNYFQEKIAEVNKQQGEWGNLEKKKEKVMIEYSQPNTHKEFHIGHLRNVFIGNALVDVFRKSGSEVIAANYIGDTGTHIAKCLWALEKFHSEEKLDAIGNKTEFLGKVYSEAVQKIEADPQNQEEFKLVQKRLEEGDGKLVALWQKTRQWSLDEFAAIYKELGVKFDVYFYESEEEQAGKKILPELLGKAHIEKSEGAIIANLEEYNLGVVVLARKDGSILYGLKDLPLAQKKFSEYKINKSIIVSDVRQELYFKQIFKILELLGFKKDLRHVAYEFVSLKGGKGMSSRKGNIIPAKKLIADVIEKIEKKFPEAPHPEEIALGAIRFSLLKVSSRTKIEFDMDESIKLEGATGPYVQYAHARICSILRKAQEKNLDFSQADLAKIVEEKELSLVRELNKFPELIEEIAEDYAVHKLPHYAIKLADKFHSFYNDLKVINEDNLEISRSRLKLVNAVKIVLAETLRLIGVNAPERM